jgi:glycosyltransferase involved in cell wall biosynthesis
MINPLISVLLPVYNAEKYLNEAINSILFQTFTNFELIIINDGSSDRSEEIIFSFSDDRINYIKNETNLGLIETLNKGISLSKGKYLARMDNDDISMPERLEKQVAFMESNPEVGVLGTSFYNINKFGEIESKTIFPVSHSLLCWSLCFFSPIAHPTVMFRRDVVINANGYNLEMLHCEDYDLWHRLSNKTRLANLPELLFKLRKHETNSSLIFSEIQLKNSIVISQKMISRLIENEISDCLISKMWSKNIKSKDRVLVADLIFKIFKSINKQFDILLSESKYLKRDFSFKIINLIHFKNIKTWKFIFFIIYIDPLFFPSSIKKYFISNK